MREEPMAMPAHLKAILDAIPQQPQRQDSTDAQLQDLRAFAVRLGLNDADDLLRILRGQTIRRLGRQASQGLGLIAGEASSCASAMPASGSPR